jgi:hypothetical protein
MSQPLNAIVNHPSHGAAAPEMDVLMVFGFFSMFLALVFFIHHRQSRAAVMGLAVCLLATSAYGFLQGAWPIAMLRSWHRRRSPEPIQTHRTGGLFWPPGPLAGETRMTDVFGVN